MIDWHSHVLPGMDDGSQSVEESVEMLQKLRAQGVNTVIATPHFYAEEESVDSFLQRRSDSFFELSQYLTDDFPKVLLGAEVRYYPGISQLENLHKLKIENSNLLLLEMPFSHWTEYTLREAETLSGFRNVTLVLAHVERYLSLQKDDPWERLLKNDVLMQANASFFTDWKTGRKALRMLQQGKIQLLGSDCHNLKRRPPQLDRAYSAISKRFGNDFLSQMNEFGHSLLV